jgi:hypothetical protein
MVKASLIQVHSDVFSHSGTSSRSAVYSVISSSSSPKCIQWSSVSSVVVMIAVFPGGDRESGAPSVRFESLQQWYGRTPTQSAKTHRGSRPNFLARVCFNI